METQTVNSLQEGADLEMKPVKRRLRLGAAFCSAALAAAILLPASASEGIISCTYVDIEGEGFVADTLNGVEARYNQWGKAISCAELVIRYYDEIYGIEVFMPDTMIYVRDRDDLYFELTDQPKAGDVMVGSAAARHRPYNHFALVKEWNGDTLTVFEQNWAWGGQAGINRVIEYPNPCYKIYTLKSTSGRPVKTLEEDKPSFWATPYIEEAAEKGIFNLEHDFTDPITRGEFCQMALNILENCGMEIEGTGAEGALAIGLVSDGDSSKLLNREEAACIVSRVAGRIGNPPLALPAALDTYTDSSEISFWAQEAVSQVTVGNLMNGKTCYFAPKDLLSKQEAVTIMLRVNETGDSITYRASRVPQGGVAAITAKQHLPVPEPPRMAG